MQIVIFGATGRTGLHLVQQALDTGHKVTAFVRTPSKMTIKHERLHLVQGDVYDENVVAQAIDGADAVLLALGHGKNTPSDMQTVATKHVVAAMQTHGVQRLISLTGAGTAAPEDQPKLIDHIIKFALKTLAANVLKDAENHRDVIQASDLNWVIVRGPMLTDGPYTGEYRVGWVGINASPRVSRADVADFMLKQLENDEYLHKMPVISN